MSLTTIDVSKELEQTYQMCLLVTFQFYDGSYLRVSTHPLNAAEGGAPYGGNDYYARIANQVLGAIQERSEQGIERLPSITLDLIDHDFAIWDNYESTLGFRDATCTAELIMVETKGWTFSTNSYNIFIGICDPPQTIANGKITISATSSNNLQKKLFPILQGNSRCTRTFPPDAASRLKAGTDRYSIFFGCGYDPDQAGTDPDTGGDCRRGNLNSGSPFTTCNYTKGDCVARGMFIKDSTNRVTGRYNGFQWVPDNTVARYSNYGTGNKIPALRVANPGILGKAIPLRYGVSWGAPLIANTIGDGNYTRYELVTTEGDISSWTSILKLVMNGVTVPHNNNIVGDAMNNGLRFDLVTTGQRSGAPTQDSGYNGKGDPYGGYAMAYAVLFLELAQSNSTPSVNALIQGIKVKQPNTANPADVASWPYSYSDNPAYVVADILIRCGWRWDDLNLQSFIDAAAVCAASVTYTDNNGASATHARYIIGCNIADQRTAAEYLNSILRGFNAQLWRDNATGKIGLLVRQGLADQQQAPITGSNYTTAIRALKTDGTNGSGYAAYAFDESNTKSVRQLMSPNASTGNRITIPIFDADNGYVQDWCIVTDTDDAARGQWANSGSIVNSNFTAVGITSFDQAFRSSRIYLAEQLRGNEQQDTRGTRRFELVSTFRLAHLRVGQIVLCKFGVKPNNYSSVVALQSPPGTAISGFLARVIRIEASPNCEEMKITAEWHEPLWYTDAYGQSVPPQFSDPRKEPPNRPPYPWQPRAIGIAVNDAIYTHQPFACALGYTANADGSATPIVSVSGRAPANSLAPSLQPPKLKAQARTASTGGIIPAGTYYVGVCGIDANGKYSALSNLSVCVIGGATSTNTIIVDISQWDPATVGYDIFVGSSELNLSTPTGAFPTGGRPASITVTSLVSLPNGYGPPDPVFHHLRTRAKRISGGVWGNTVNVVGAHTLKFTGATFTVNEYAGHVISLIGQAAGGGLLVWSSTITSNTADTLTVSALTTGYVHAGDVLVMRAMGVTTTANTIQDPLWVNSLVPAGLPVNAEAGNLVRIIGGKGAGQPTNTIVSNTADTLTIAGTWDIQPDATSIFIIEEPNWFYDFAGSIIVSDNPAHGATQQVGEVSVDNVVGLTILIQVVAEDFNDNSLGEWNAPFREIYVAGDAGTAGATRLAERSITAPTTVATTDNLLNVDTTGGGFTQTIPDATLRTGSGFLVFKKTSADANSLVIDTTGTDTIDGASSVTLTAQNDFVLLTPVAGGYKIIGQRAAIVSSGYIPGSDSITMDGTSHEFVIDLANGFKQKLLLDAATASGGVTIASIPPIIWTGGPAITGDIPAVTLYIDQDSDVAGGWPMPTPSSAAGGFMSGIVGLKIDQTPDTRTTLVISFHDDVGLWGMDSFRTGDAKS